MAVDRIGEWRCLHCNGRGSFAPVLSLACGPRTSRAAVEPARTCDACDGTGSVSEADHERQELGRQCREARLVAGLGQVSMAASVGVVAYDYSKAEALGIGEEETFSAMRRWLEGGHAVGRTRGRPDDRGAAGDPVGGQWGRRGGRDRGRDPGGAPGP